MSVFLINLTRDGVEDQRFQHENLGLLYLKSALELENVSVSYIDCQLEFVSTEIIIEKIMKSNTILVGISSSVQALLPKITKFVQELREAGYKNHITLGGVFASIEAERLLSITPEIDSIGIGEGEKQIVQLYYALKQKKPLKSVDGLAFREKSRIIMPDIIPYNADLDVVGYPSRSDVPRILKLGRRVSLVASRGCISNCIFCSSQSIKCLGIPRRQRSASGVVEEMVELYNKFGVQRFKFNDPVFIQPGKMGITWCYDFIKNLKNVEPLRFDYVINLRALECLDEKLMGELAKSGLKKVVLGIESGSDKILKWMNKPTNVELNNKAIHILKKCGIEVEICFIFFVPVMSLEDIEQNIKFLSKHNALSPFVLTSILEVYNGSIVEKKLEEDNKLLRNNWWEIGEFDFYDKDMKKFWTAAQPIFMKINKVIEELYFCDVLIQKEKHSLLKKNKRERYDFYVQKSGEILAQSYERLINLIILKEDKFDGLYQEYEILISKLVSDICEYRTGVLTF